MAHSPVIQFGLPENWEQFEKRHKFFLKGLPLLEDAAREILTRTLNSEKIEDNAIFGLGQLCAEDFQEILLLSGNGYGTGAMKILRGMFERTVDAFYLDKHPEEAEAFFDFADVDLSKLIRSAEEHFGGKFMSEERLTEVQKLKEQAEALGKSRSWTKKDVVTRAKEAGLGPDIPLHWYAPMKEVHSSARAIMSRMFTFDEHRRWEIVEGALSGAHTLFLRMLRLQVIHFNLRKEATILGYCYRAFERTWSMLQNNFNKK